MLTANVDLLVSGAMDSVVNIVTNDKAITIKNEASVVFVQCKSLG